MHDRFNGVESDALPFLHSHRLGNGSFFYVEVESPDFEGKSKLQCHRMVQDIVSKQIENIHGLRIKTSTPPKTA